MELQKIFTIVRSYLWLFVGAIVVASLTTFLFVRSQPALYEAKTLLIIGPGVDNPSPALNSLRIGGQLMQTYAEMVETRPFLETIDKDLELKMDLRELGEMIEVRTNEDTRILSIYVQHEDPEKAIAIANAAANTLVGLSPSRENNLAPLRDRMASQTTLLEQIILDAEASIAQLEEDLLTLDSKEVTGAEVAQKDVLEEQNLIIKQLADERGRLSDSLRTLAIYYELIQEVSTNQVNIIEPSVVALSVNQYSLMKVAISGVAGLVFAVVAVLIVENYGEDIQKFVVQVKDVETSSPFTVKSEQYFISGKKQLEAEKFKSGD